MKILWAGREDYDCLPDIDAPGVASTTDDDRHCLSALGNVLVETGLYESFGVTRLHRHFEVQENEVLFEWLTPNRKFVLVDPKPVSLLQSFPCTPTNVSLRKTSDGLVGVATEFAEAHEVPQADWTNPKFGKVYDVLADLKKTDRFGLGLIRNRLDVKASQIMLERTFSDRRRLFTEAVERDSEADLERDIQTFWQFYPASNYLPDMQMGMQWVCRGGVQQVCRFESNWVCRQACRANVIPFLPHERYHSGQTEWGHVSRQEWAHQNRYEYVPD